MVSKKANVFYVNSLTVANDVRYLTGFVAPDPFILLLIGSKRFLIVSALEKGRAIKISNKKTIILTPQELNLGKNTLKVSFQIFEILKKEKVQIANVDKSFPHWLAEDLKAHGIEILIKSGDIKKRRRIKNQQEIDKIKYVQKASAKVMREAIDIIHNSEINTKGHLLQSKKILSSEYVQALIQKRLLDFGCSANEVIVAGGEQAVDPHERGYGPLFKDSAIIIDIFPRHEKSGYWGDITRTVCCGSPSPKLARMYKAVLTAQKKALSLVQDGIDGSSIHKTVQEYFFKQGYYNICEKGRPGGFIHGTGHGVGLDIHESPRIGASKQILKAGDVITIEPGLYYPGLGGIRIEDTVVVEKNGCELLATCKKNFTK